MITLFATETCPNCEIIKKQLDKKGIEYEKSNDLEMMASLGIRSVPAILNEEKELFVGLNEIIEKIIERK
jgi:glutaredoxin